MDKQIDYTVIEADSPQSLVDGVCAAIKAGWQTTGGVVARPRTVVGGPVGTLFLQALVKYEPLIAIARR